MKSNFKFFLIATLFFSFLQINAQEKTGEWYGSLNAMGKEIPIGAIIKQETGSFIGELTNPAQGNKGIKMDSISIVNNFIYFELKALKIRFVGKFKESKIIGKFNQSGMEFPLEFSRKKPEITKPKRPQTPKPPFNYYTEEITIKNITDSISLLGTLTLPTNDGKKYPVVILISGSGPQNRDSEIFGHKSFWVIADYFAKQSIGTFRYDERGVGKSTGKYSGSDLNDFYRDIDFIVKNIQKRKNIKKIGLLGHSEGGIIAPWYASNSNKIKFVILLAAPGIKPKEMMHDQRRLQSILMGTNQAEIKSQELMFRKIDSTVLASTNDSILKIELRNITNKRIKQINGNKKQMEKFANQIIPLVTSKWYKSFISINPKNYLSKIKCSVLAINGGKDRQVSMESNLKAIAKALANGKCSSWQTIKRGDLNHLFQNCEIGSVDEYEKIEETFSKEVLKDMATWILSK